jgi:hypothetical protein
MSGATEEYDGSSWTTLPTSIGTARDRATFGQVQELNHLALAFGGRTSLYSMQQKNLQVQEQR